MAQPRDCTEEQGRRQLHEVQALQRQRGGDGTQPVPPREQPPAAHHLQLCAPGAAAPRVGTALLGASPAAWTAFGTPILADWDFRGFQKSGCKTLVENG